VRGSETGDARQSRPQWRRDPLCGGLILAALLLAGSVSGCASTPWERAVDTWSRSERAHVNFETRAILHAALKSSDFRAAWVDAYARTFALSTNQRAQLSASEEEVAAGRVTVLAAFYTAEPRWNSLNPADGLWEVRLETDRGDIAHPVSVRRLDTSNPVWGTLLPWLDPFSQLYELQFDAASLGPGDHDKLERPLALVVAGAAAHLRLSWTRQ
jgi:hypothetical protein